MLYQLSYVRVAPILPRLEGRPGRARAQGKTAPPAATTPPFETEHLEAAPLAPG
jgi:hypothetical protein